MAGPRSPAVEQKAVCASCLVREECLAYALAESITEGVWGGMTTRERRELRSRRPSP